MKAIRKLIVIGAILLVLATATVVWHRVKYGYTNCSSYSIPECIFKDVGQLF